MGNTMCWDFQRCGRESDRSCPAVTQLAGRACWLVAGTMCGGEVQGTVAQKLSSCRECEFYQRVKGRDI